MNEEEMLLCLEKGIEEFYVIIPTEEVDNHTLDQHKESFGGKVIINSNYASINSKGTFSWEGFDCKTGNHCLHYSGLSRTKNEEVEINGEIYI